MWFGVFFLQLFSTSHLCSDGDLEVFCCLLLFFRCYGLFTGNINSSSKIQQLFGHKTPLSSQEMAFHSQKKTLLGYNSHFVNIFLVIKAPLLRKKIILMDNLWPVSLGTSSSECLTSSFGYFFFFRIFGKHHLFFLQLKWKHGGSTVLADTTFLLFGRHWNINLFLCFFKSF